MLNTQRSKALIVLDLDYTVFKFNEPGIVWLGGREFWLQMLEDISLEASQNQCDLVFAVVTNKVRFDDLCEASAAAFMPFLKRHNAAAYKVMDNKEWCLVKLACGSRYECLQTKNFIPENTEGLCSHFVITPFANKGIEIEKIAKFHGIPLNHCFLLDDTPDVLTSTRAKGINTISFECFHHLVPTILSKLSDADYVSQNLAAKKAELKNKLIDLFNAIAFEQMSGDFQYLSFHVTQQYETLKIHNLEVEVNPPKSKSILL